MNQKFHVLKVETTIHIKYQTINFEIVSLESHVFLLPKNIPTLLFSKSSVYFVIILQGIIVRVRIFNIKCIGPYD